MNISFRLAHSTDFSSLADLYFKYLTELMPYSIDIDRSVKARKHSAKKALIEYVEGKWTFVYLIFLDKSAIGFFVLGVFPQSYTLEDVYIIQFYIEKSYQKRGYGSSVLEQIPKKCEHVHMTDPISMFILQGNPASMFWEKIFSRLGYIDLVISGKIKPPTSENMADGYLPRARFCYWSPLNANENQIFK